MNVQEELLNSRIDPFLSDRALSHLAGEALGENVHVVGYTILTGGCWNRVIAVDAGGTKIVIKISPHDDDGRIAREFLVLREFAERSDMPVPEPLFLDHGTHIPGTALVMTRLPGEVMHQCLGLLNYGERRRIIREIAECVVELHARRGIGFGGVELHPEDRHEAWSEFWLPRFDTVLSEAESAAVVPEPVLEGAREIRPELAHFLSQVTVPVMTHYDIWSGNVMIDAEADPPRVTGFIDIPGFFADYAREISFAMLFGVADRNFLEIYRSAYDVDDGFETRVAIYNLKMNIKHIIMYPGESYYQIGALRCLETIRRAAAGA